MNEQSFMNWSCLEERWLLIPHNIHLPSQSEEAKGGKRNQNLSCSTRLAVIAYTLTATTTSFFLLLCHLVKHEATAYC